MITGKLSIVTGEKSHVSHETLTFKDFRRTLFALKGTDTEIRFVDNTDYEPIKISFKLQKELGLL